MRLGRIIIIIIMIVLYFYLKNQTRYSAITYRIIRDGGLPETQVLIKLAAHYHIYMQCRDTVLPDGEDCITLRSLLLTQYMSVRVTDRRTDRQTDGFAVAYTALTKLCLAERYKNLVQNQPISEQDYSDAVRKHTTSETLYKEDEYQYNNSNNKFSQSNLGTGPRRGGL